MKTYHLYTEACKTEEPDARKLHVRNCVYGDWVTGIPTTKEDFQETILWSLENDLDV